ncbi:MAG: hydroxypyruvate isomerase family protein [Proteobacteria bacterium]|nr:hydroxypyruvate isomerase family protein [Pseudomonadota bacterium]
MLKFAANLSFLYQDLPFLDRFNAAATDGFRGVEYLFPYEHAPDEISNILQDNGLTQVLFNMRAGDWEAGERGLASLPGRSEEFKSTVQEALDYAEALSCGQVHVMAGLRDKEASHAAQLDTYCRNIAYAAEEAAKRNLVVLIEPINNLDMPGFFLENVTMAKGIIEEISNPSLRLQFDMYHVQKTDGDICRQFEGVFDLIGHIQIANPPHRFEPDNGEINYPYLFNMLEEAGYGGWIGCEYKPSGPTSETLTWAKEYLRS